MKMILAGCLALWLALLWDRKLRSIGIYERVRIGILIPVGEELFKFGIAFIFNLHPTILYFIFGCGEGLYEMFHSKKKMGFLLLAAGILTHTFFGVFYLLKLSIWFSFIAALTSHLIWNNAIMGLQNHYNGRSN